MTRLKETVSLWRDEHLLRRLYRSGPHREAPTRSHPTRPSHDGGPRENTISSTYTYRADSYKMYIYMHGHGSSAQVTWICARPYTRADICIIVVHGFGVLPSGGYASLFCLLMRHYNALVSMYSAGCSSIGSLEYLNQFFNRSTPSSDPDSHAHTFIHKLIIFVTRYNALIE